MYAIRSYYVFFLAPAFLGKGLDSLLHIGSTFQNLIEGVIRLIFVILYIWGISKMPDIARVFAYHGAEHKTINAFEASCPLNPSEVKNSYNFV